MFRLLLMVFLGLLLHHQAYAQNIIEKNITREDGLPSNKIYNIGKDSKGYLWISTDKGLARYNGRSFEIFTTSNGLPDNEIFSTYEDAEQRLWIANFKGVLCYLKDGIFHTASNTPWLNFSSKPPAFIDLPIADKDGTLTCIARDGQSFLVIVHNNIKSISLKKLAAEVPDIPRPICVRKYGKNQFKAFFYNCSIIFDESGSIIKKTPNKQGHLYVGVGSSGLNPYLFSEFGIESIDGEIIKNSKKIPFDFVSIASMYMYIRDTTTFVATDKGLYFSDFNTLLKHTLSSVAGDRDGNIWYSSLNKGLFHIDKNFQNITNFNLNQKVFIARKIGENLFFIAADGNFYKKDHGEVHLLNNNHIPLSEKSLDWSRMFITQSGDAVFLSKASNVSDYGIKDNKRVPNLYIGHDKAGKYHKYPISWDNPIKTNATIKNIFEFDSSLYISTISMLFSIPIAALSSGKPAHRKILIDAHNDDENRIYDRAINPLDSSLWISRANGILSLKNGILGSIKIFQNRTFYKFKFFKNYFVGFTAENKLFIGNTTSSFLDSIVIPNCIWENIYPIDDHRLIMSTNNYFRTITLFPPDRSGKPRYSVNTVENTFLNQETNYVATDTANCYFFNGEQMTTVKTAILFEKPQPPTPVFLSFKSTKATYPVRNISHIPYDDAKTINITFDNISFAAQDLTTEYSISNTDQDHWEQIASNEINLSHPGYGRYYIKLRSKTLSSNYSKPIQIIIDIEKPFWATWWFIIACGACLIALVYLIIHVLTQRNLRKKQMEHDADMKYQQSEYKALNALMNPHFIFNSLNNIQGLINKDEKLTANQYLVIFSDLIRQNMHNISQGFISLQQELLLVENYLNLEKLRFKEFINYSIDIHEEVEVEDIMIPPLMIQPLVENAVKHGLLPRQSNESKVQITVYEQDDILYIEIKDNGIGLTESLAGKNKLHESYGLSNLHKRIDHLKKIQKEDINIEVNETTDAEGNVSGTRAIIMMHLH